MHAILTCGKDMADDVADAEQDGSMFADEKWHSYCCQFVTERMQTIPAEAGVCHVGRSFEDLLVFGRVDDGWRRGREHPRLTLE